MTLVNAGLSPLLSILDSIRIDYDAANEGEALRR